MGACMCVCHLPYQTECHSQVRHNPLVPVKQNLAGETLECRAMWVGLADEIILSTGY